MHGAGEGRKPYNEATLDMTNILFCQDTDAAVPEQSTETSLPTTPSDQDQPAPSILMRDGKQLTDENTIMAVQEQDYRIVSQ